MGEFGKHRSGAVLMGTDVQRGCFTGYSERHSGHFQSADSVPLAPLVCGGMA